MQSVLNGSLRAISVTRYEPERELEDLNQPVRLCLLGGIRLLSNGRPVSVRNGGKLEALLVHLGLASSQGIRREDLLGAVWPDSDTTLAGHALNTLVHRLRDLLGEALRGAPTVVQASGYYRLNYEAGVSVDVAVFKSLAAQADRCERIGQTAAALELCERAVALYGGDLSAFEDGGAQSMLERAFLRASYLTLLMRLSDSYFAQRHFVTCLSYALKLLAHDPCREDAHRLVMRCYVRRAERAQALRHYGVVREILREEFDAVPEPATTALFDQLDVAVSQDQLRDPNGLAFSPDYKKLYVTSTGKGPGVHSRLRWAPVKIRLESELRLPSRASGSCSWSARNQTPPRASSRWIPATAHPRLRTSSLWPRFV